MPWGFAKWVWARPSSRTCAFIFATPSAMVPPPKYSASRLAPSLALTIWVAYSASVSGTSSPSCRAMWLESVPASEWTSSWLTVSFTPSQLPCAFSQARARVITLVMEAGCSSSFMFCWASTRPVSASMMQYARVALSAGPAAAAPGISTRIISSTVQSAVVSFFIWFSPSGSLAARRAAPAGHRF